MKIRYLALAILIAVGTQFSAKAEMPSQIKRCLMDPNYTAPKQYREFARVKDGSSTYVFLHSVMNLSEVPNSSVLLKVEGGQCKRVGGHFLNLFDDLSKLVPRQVAVILSDRKWRSVLKFRNGRQYIQDILNPKPVRNEMGENLQPINLSSLDRQVLQKIGVR